MSIADGHLCLIRCLKLLQLIGSSRFGVTIEDMVTEVGISRRTVCRYISVLRKANIRVQPDREGVGIAKKWRLVNQREHLAKIGIL